LSLLLISSLTLRIALISVTFSGVAIIKGAGLPDVVGRLDKARGQGIGEGRGIRAFYTSSSLCKITTGSIPITISGSNGKRPYFLQEEVIL
jgi:hypothetical protein